ncbi:MULTISPECIES: restriction endonuclease subunit S [Acinetobacter calcoaceticus/baumannii complex]|uniref:restriction endonuclease subunit S n=1 Tax=Acinetobacter calcoaceticus/baumannii complex TaxID=909768 RepID=UPI0011A47EDB|nr:MULTISPECIES: restriction endonuclease subunit S [Acinetobacter calcoaceticus/baumannii complex]MCP9173670.1 restriction endonuclease subunit S [Acinetobacter baumannii]MDQ8922734.1 restriction endonuclease subunit S [Acinetobacter baumannii]MDQ8926133.1 restriction endonuclease subunit S [Acinetobacter baumannii]MDQ8933057.1 restriction endonuclease subunit S [Acinetobacter baumannii]MDQ9036427.1 restriction endonuclease subunit S [Acinetobacter seifertii]
MVNKTAAKYKAYAEYKNSGVEWLGKIPSHWLATQVKYGYLVTLGKMLQSTPKSSLDELKLYLKAQNIQPNGINIDQVESMWFSPDECKKLLLQKSDVLVSEGGDAGRSAIWNCELEECYIQNAINRVRPKYVNNSKYFLYWMKFLKSTDFINIICNKATIAHYTAEKLEGSPIFLPSSDEQIAIANFLDHETTKIDHLIEKQQQLIELLKEKRQAVISHAVTKGLDPNVPMKDSGVAWLGEVPEHWDTTKIKYVAELTPKKSEVSSNDNRLCTFVPMEKLKLGSLIKDEEKPISEVIGGYTYFKNGDLLLAKVTPCFENKNMVVASDLKNGIGFGSSEIYVLRANHKVNTQFLYYRLQEDQFMELGTGAMTGAGGLKRVPSEFLNNFQFALPPLSEQIAITKYLNQYLIKNEYLMNKAQSAIQLMQERRTALISAAVTGKIDVRHWQAPNVTEADTELSA